MKKEFFLFVILVLLTGLLYAQPPGRPDQPVYTIPKKDILKPQNPKLIPITFEQILDDASWHGTRTWRTATGVTIDSVTTISFFLQSKQVSWAKQGWEYVSPKPGSYSITNNKISIQFNYPPYTHYLEGTYNATTKKISGTFREERAETPTAPSAYKAGTTSGEFVFIQK